MSSISISIINCSACDMVALIYELWRAAKAAPFFVSYAIIVPKTVSPDDIQEQLEANYFFIDILKGRWINMDFSKWPEVDARSFNQNNGFGSFEKCLEKAINK